MPTKQGVIAGCVYREVYPGRYLSGVYQGGMLGVYLSGVYQGGMLGVYNPEV